MRRKSTDAVALLMMVMAVAVAGASAQPAQAKAFSGSGIRIAVLYIDTPTGARFLAGVEAALRQNGDAAGKSVCIRETDVSAADVERGKVRCIAYPYTNEKIGLEKLEQILRSQSVDLILGPTDSGVFIDAIEKRKDLEVNGIPVISSMVTAAIPHQSGGWFFRTNIDVNRRSEAIYDFLNKRWVRSIALLYAKTAFGRSGEEAFRGELSDIQRRRYMPMLYESPPMQARHHLKRILDTRPEAVGIIGSREDINELYGAIKRMNTSTEYAPLFFTIIDARFAGKDVDEMYFVTVTNDSGQSLSPAADGTRDDVSALSFDTARLALDEWAKVPVSNDRRLMRSLFRDRIEAVMKGGSVPDSMTRLSFSGYLNTQRPKVAVLNAEGVSTVDLRAPVSFWKNLVGKYELTVRRFGFWPWLNLALVALIVVVMSVVDIKKWYHGSKLSLFFKPGNWLFYLVIGINAVAAIPLYIYMGETGAIQYDSVIAAIALAIAPMAILRTNVFETPAGKSIGLGKMYDALIQWINHRLMIQKHFETKTAINLLAYNNSVDNMKSYLSDVYKNERTVAQRVRLQTELDEMVNDSLPYLQRRKECAKLLLRTIWDWNLLREEGLAPEGKPKPPSKPPWLRWVADKKAGERQHEAGIPKEKYLEDPEVVIRRLAGAFSQNEKAMEELDRQIDEQIKAVSPERRNALLAAHDRDLAGIISQRGRVRRKLAFLCILRGFDEGHLKQMLESGVQSKQES